MTKENDECEVCGERTESAGTLYDDVCWECWMLSLIEGLSELDDLPRVIMHDLLPRRFTITLRTGESKTLGVHTLLAQLKMINAEVPTSDDQKIVHDVMYTVLEVPPDATVNIVINDEELCTITREV
jgi:hypothetical protein